MFLAHGDVLQTFHQTQGKGTLEAVHAEAPARQALHQTQGIWVVAAEGALESYSNAWQHLCQTHMFQNYLFQTHLPQTWLMPETQHETQHNTQPVTQHDTQHGIPASGAAWLAMAMAHSP